MQLIIKHEAKTWFGFLDDIIPSGAARRYWINYLNLQKFSHAEQDSILLEKGVIAPVGNLRIKESIPPINPESTLHLRKFSTADVADRNADFLEYAQQMGAISGEQPVQVVKHQNCLCVTQRIKKSGLILINKALILLISITWLNFREIIAVKLTVTF